MEDARSHGPEKRSLRHYESYADKQIREAIERGEFDDLPGSGEPLRGIGVYDPDWWAKGFVRREKARARADDLRRAIRSELPRLRMSSERVAADRVAELNRMVAAVNEHLPEKDQIPDVEL